MKRSRVIHDSDSEPEEDIKDTLPPPNKRTIEKKAETPSKEVLAPNSHQDKATSSNSGAQKNEQKPPQKNTQVVNSQKKPQPSSVKIKTPISDTQDKSNNKPPIKKKPPIAQLSKPIQVKENMVSKKKPMIETKTQGIKKRKIESPSESPFSSHSSESSVPYSESSFGSDETPQSNGIFN